jgi:hypothetical protein
MLVAPLRAGIEEGAGLAVDSVETLRDLFIDQPEAGKAFSERRRIR